MTTILGAAESAASPADTPIRRLFATLKGADMPVEIAGIAEAPVSAPERIDLLLLRDHGNRDLVLSMVFIDDVVATQAPPEDISAEDWGDDDAGMSLFSLSVVLPYPASAETAAGTMQLLMDINRMLAIGAFGYGSPDHGLYWSYTLGLDSPASLSGLMVDEIVNLAGYQIETYGPLIERVASGAATRESLMAEIEQLGGVMPPVGPPRQMSPELTAAVDAEMAAMAAEMAAEGEATDAAHGGPQ